jgi:hypothetical protein
MKLRHLAWLVFFAAGVARADGPDWVHGDYSPGDFALAQNGSVAAVYVAPEDYKAAQIAAGNFTEDVERVTGHKPALVTDAGKLSGPAVLVGTLGHSAVIDALVAQKKFPAEQLQGQWESYLIGVVANPLPGVPAALVIAGSDRRGTAYGVFEVSQAIGVSPWYWWADVTPAHRDNLFVSPAARRFGPPSVQYRGIFLNDEDWGLNPWASKTFEPEVGNIGPKTYAKVFELLLRLKANVLWPAMHKVSTAFNAIPENKQVADDYGIVMGSSHCEPMLRNNVGEWTDPASQFNFITNADGVTKYWEQRMQENGMYENMYTIGMRGIHDDPMIGIPLRDSALRVATLEKIFQVQRGLIAKYVNPDPTKVPQIFCPYKEVLADYLSNLQVPPDVTVVFPDDNFGYIRYFPTDQEIAQRPGGFGVYYHISYLGSPFSYRWLNTTPPALMWEELSKAYDHGMKKLWILNVGGLKPGEIGIDFFTQMAWDINKWNRGNLAQYLPAFAKEQFGAEYADDIRNSLAEYFRLGYQRKPEHLQWNVGREPPRPSDFTHVDYGDEALARINAYTTLATHAGLIGTALPAAKQDAYYELVEYPIEGSDLANTRFFMNEEASLWLNLGVAAAYNEAGSMFAGFNHELEQATDHFNNDLAGGKWKLMMPDDVLQKDRSYRAAALQPTEIPDGFKPADAPGIGVAIEGRADALHPGETAAVPYLDPFVYANRFIVVFDTGSTHASWTAKPDADWIELSQNSSEQDKGAGTSPNADRIFATVDWAKAPHGADVSGNIVIGDGKSTYTVTVPIYNPASPTREDLAGMFVQVDGVVSMEAEHFNSKTDRNGAGWEIIPGLGRTGDAVGVFPTTTPSVALEKVATDAPELDYKFYLLQAGNVTIHYNLIPTQPLHFGQGLRYAVAVDDETPQLVTITKGTGNEVTNRAWSENVLDNTTTAETTHAVAQAGAHVLHIYMIDPGVLLEKIVVDAGGLRPSYLGPPETRVAAAEKAP